jgi:hypothetical protein
VGAPTVAAEIVDKTVAPGLAPLGALRAVKPRFGGVFLTFQPQLLPCRIPKGRQCYVSTICNACSILVA